ncbi:MAG: type VI secretion system protein ImpF [Methyloprofundus sp.]|nr:MAG: type VI secretion system protein ImpF [Methyloprofundus sp.]
MARTLPKERFLPSLLDRLTDDDPINSSIQLHKQKIKRLEKELTAVLGKQKTLTEGEYKKQANELQAQLDQTRAQYTVLTASVSSLTEIRACVKRDLNWLLNSRQYEIANELQNYQEIRRSVINYGMSDLTGKTVSGVELRSIERMLKQSIIDFEPRIIQKTLFVRIMADQSMFNHNAVTFEIEGQLWAEPEPLHLHLRTEFEMESGNVSVYDFHEKESK